MTYFLFNISPNLFKLKLHEIANSCKVYHANSNIGVVAIFSMASSTVTNVLNGGGPYEIQIQNDFVSVVSIPLQSIAQAAWWIIREYSLRANEKKKCFSLLIMDDDCLSIVCSQKSLLALESLNLDGLKVSPQRWRAFVVGSTADLPGYVCYLSESLSQEGMTYDMIVFITCKLILFVIIINGKLHDRDKHTPRTNL